LMRRGKKRIFFNVNRSAGGLSERRGLSAFGRALLFVNACKIIPILKGVKARPSRQRIGLSRRDEEQRPRPSRTLQR